MIRAVISLTQGKTYAYNLSDQRLPVEINDYFLSCLSCISRWLIMANDQTLGSLLHDDGNGNEDVTQDTSSNYL